MWLLKFDIVLPVSKVFLELGTMNVLEWKIAVFMYYMTLFHLISGLSS